jgi:hypothetical protein
MLIIGAGRQINERIVENRLPEITVFTEEQTSTPESSTEPAVCLVLPDDTDDSITTATEKTEAETTVFETKTELFTETITEPVDEPETYDSGDRVTVETHSEEKADPPVTETEKITKTVPKPEPTV